jgi:hypothetical protein
MGFSLQKPSQATRNAAPEISEEEETKGRTNYKKRYDDLKKHYDQKIATFKQKELELTAMAQRHATCVCPA